MIYLVKKINLEYITYFTTIAAIERLREHTYQRT